MLSDMKNKAAAMADKAFAMAKEKGLLTDEQINMAKAMAGKTVESAEEVAEMMKTKEGRDKLAMQMTGATQDVANKALTAAKEKGLVTDEQVGQINATAKQAAEDVKRLAGTAITTAEQVSVLIKTPEGRDELASQMKATAGQAAGNVATSADKALTLAKEKGFVTEEQVKCMHDMADKAKAKATAAAA